MVTELEVQILERLTRIETKIESPAKCEIHHARIKAIEKRTTRVEVQLGKQNLVAVCIGALGAGLTILGKYLITKLLNGGGP